MPWAHEARVAHTWTHWLCVVALRSLCGEQGSVALAVFLWALAVRRQGRGTQPRPHRPHPASVPIAAWHAGGADWPRHAPRPKHVSRFVLSTSHALCCGVGSGYPKNEHPCPFQSRLADARYGHATTQPALR